MRVLSLCVILFLLAGCAGTPRLSAIHNPLYRAENHTSTITARARESQDGIAEISITAIVGELTACTESQLLPSLIPCRRNASAMGTVCVFPNTTTEVTCSLPVAITPQRLVTYSATARSATNRTASTGSVTYAGGAPLTQTTINFPFVGQIPVNWETARPVIWRTNDPSATTDRADKIDFGFVPDPDMPNYRGFTDDLHSMVMNLFYNDTNQYSTWPRTWKNLFNIWAGPAGADAEECTHSFGEPAATVRGAFDGTAVLHRNSFRDCASISLGGGSGTSQTTLPNFSGTSAEWVLLHESGHFLFGLGDEYVGGGNSSISAPKNVYGDEATCQSNSTANGIASAQCVQIGMSGTWRNDDGLATTMEDPDHASDFRTLSGVAMSNRISACVGGACY
jgi:hypothetical protein